jgi:hypothetical protein
MWYGRHGRFAFRFGFPPFGFWFHSMRPFPRRQEYLEMEQEYKKELIDGAEAEIIGFEMGLYGFEYKVRTANPFFKIGLCKISQAD